jgi:hypothetical protein
MLPQVLDLDYTSPITWLAPGVGIAVAALVFVLLGRVRRGRRRRPQGGSKEEDLSWEDLLEALRRRRREREEAGLADDDDLPPDELFRKLLTTLPAAALPEPAAEVEDYKAQDRGGIGRGPEAAPEDLNFQAQWGAERRAGRRRWGNPTEVYVVVRSWQGPVHGLVINRSTGGLAILLQQEVPAGTAIEVHSVEAPRSVPFVTLEVCHCLKAGRLFLIGGRFCEEVPWNVRVWFG